MRMASRRLRQGGVVGAAVGLVVSMVVAAGPAAAAPTATLALGKEALVSGTGTPLTSPVTPGGAFDHQLSAACSGLTQGCIGATTAGLLGDSVALLALGAGLVLITRRRRC
jgi:hypothetical protein